MDTDQKFIDQILVQGSSYPVGEDKVLSKLDLPTFKLLRAAHGTKVSSVLRYSLDIRNNKIANKAINRDIIKYLTNDPDIVDIVMESYLDPSVEQKSTASGVPIHSGTNPKLNTSAVMYLWSNGANVKAIVKRIRDGKGDNENVRGLEAYISMIGGSPDAPEEYDLKEDDDYENSNKYENNEDNGNEDKHPIEDVSKGDVEQEIHV